MTLGVIFKHSKDGFLLKELKNITKSKIRIFIFDFTVKFATFGVGNFLGLKKMIASAIVFNVQYGNSGCQVSN